MEIVVVNKTRWVTERGPTDGVDQRPERGLSPQRVLSSY